MTPSPNQPDRLWTNLSAGVLLVFTFANIFLLLFILPKFGQIYQDAIPDRPLPLLTQCIFAGRIIILIVNIAWLILCIYFAIKRKADAILLINLGAIFNFLQIGYTIIVLFIPMTGTITGMSDGDTPATPIFDSRA